MIQRIEIPAQSISLLSFEQLGIDYELRITEPDLNQFTIDHPGGRLGPEYFIVGPYLKNEELIVELTHPTQKPVFEYSHTSLETSSDTHNAFSLVTQAGSLAASRTETDFSEVVRLYQVAYELIDPNSEHAANVQFLIASALYEKTDLSGALSAVRNVRADLLKDGQYLTKWLESQILFSQDQYQESQFILEGIMSISESRIDNEEAFHELVLADQKTTYGTLLVLLNESEAGKSHLDSAYEIASRYNALELLASIYNSYGTYFFYTGDPKEAANSLSDAVELIWNTPNSKMLSYILGNLTITYTNLGEFQLARDAGHTTLLIAEESDDFSQLALTYQNLASLYLRIGEYYSALEFAKISQEFELSAGREWRSFIALNQEGDALLGLQRDFEAIEKYQEALSFFETNGPVSRTLSTHERLVSVYTATGQLNKAREHLNNASDLISANPDRFNSTRMDRLTAAEAKINLVEGQIDDSILLFQSVYENLGGLALPLHVDVASGLMSAYAQKDQLSLAVEYGLQAIEYMDAIRGQLEYSRLGPAWSAQTHEIYLELYSHLNSLNLSSNNDYDVLAYQIAESSLATNLTQQRLAAARIENSGRTQNNSYSDRLANLAISRTSLNPDGSYTDSTVQYFRARERFQAELDLNPVSPLPPVPTINDVQQKLSTTSVILEFICVEENSCYRTQISTDDFSITRIADFSEIWTLAETLNQSITSPGTYSESAGKQLGDILFSELNISDFEQVLLVANAPLNTIPVAVIGSGDTNSQSRLIDVANVSYLPSVSAAISSSTEPLENYSHDVAVLADPIFSQSVALADLGSRGGSEQVSNWAESLDRLPWTAEEANSLNRVYSGLSIKTMTGTQANRTNLLHESSRNSRVLHIASHGYFDSRTPDLVGIAVSPEGNGPGFITLEDLLLFEFNNELVVISGCETGLGENRGGEGVMSLSRGFLAQGANNVLATLWPVSDRASAEFMRIFYEILDKDLLNVSEALRQTQLAMSQHPVFNDPFYWAAYTLTSLRI